MKSLPKNMSIVQEVKLWWSVVQLFKRKPFLHAAEIARLTGASLKSVRTVLLSEDFILTPNGDYRLKGETRQIMNDKSDAA